LRTKTLITHKATADEPDRAFILGSERRGVQLVGCLIILKTIAWDGLSGGDREAILFDGVHSQRITKPSLLEADN
jgi:hypothetical protein